MQFLLYTDITWQSWVISLLSFHPQLSSANKGYFTDKPSNSILAATTFSKRENINCQMFMQVNQKETLPSFPRML